MTLEFRGKETCFDHWNTFLLLAVMISISNLNHSKLVEFVALTVVTLINSVLWDVTPCSLVEI
jgi:hypothetical protein